MKGATPGERRGDRQKGTPNKTTKDLAETVEALGLDPIQGMAEIGLDKTVAVSIRSQLPESHSKRRRHIGQYASHTKPPDRSSGWTVEHD